TVIPMFSARLSNWAAFIILSRRNQLRPLWYSAPPVLASNGCSVIPAGYDDGAFSNRLPAANNNNKRFHHGQILSACPAAVAGVQRCQPGPDRPAGPHTLYFRSGRRPRPGL